MVRRLALTALLLVLGLAPAALAGPVTFKITFDDEIGNSGSGTLTAEDLSSILGPNAWGVTFASFTVDTGSAAGNYELILNPNSNWAAFISPSGHFQTDNVMYYPGDPHFNTNGILLKEIGGSHHEANIWGNSPGSYQFWSWHPAQGWDVASSNFAKLEVTPVPDLGSSLLLMGMGLAGLFWNHKHMN